jgi:hypothetical protein
MLDTNQIVTFPPCFLFSGIISTVGKFILKDVEQASILLL